MSVMVYLIWPLVASGLFLILLLLLPMGWLRPRVNAFLAKVVFFECVGKIPSISFVILGSALSVLVTGYETYSRSRDASIVSLDRKLDADLKFMRKQRNFWVSLLLLVLWILVYFMLKLSQSMAAAEQQLEQLKLEKRVLEEERDRASDLARIQSARAAASAK